MRRRAAPAKEPTTSRGRCTTSWSDRRRPTTAILPNVTTRARPSGRRGRAQPAISSKADARAKPVRLLTGGNPQIAKADGDVPVQAYIAAMPGWRRDIGQRLDTLIERTAPGVCKAIKWNSPFYGIEGQGWFVSFHTFTRYVKVSFFKGTSLQPVPPGGTGKDVRWIDIHEHDLEEAQLTTWIRQAAALPGWLNGAKDDA